jgi:hypothetical protein
MAPEQITERPDAVAERGAPIRERVAVRKRRSRKAHRSRNWSARSSRRRIVRNFLVCTGVLLLMAAGVYMGLSRQEGAPVEGSVTPVTTLAAAG